MQSRYRWEVEFSDGSIETKGGNFDKKVVRFSLIPNNLILPRHDIIFTDFKFIRRFCRTFMSYGVGVKDCIHCVVTDRFRYYIKYSNGQCLIVDKDYELYI